MKIDTKHIKTSVVVFLIIATLAVYWIKQHLFCKFVFSFLVIPVYIFK